MGDISIQEAIGCEHCFGCGTRNPDGLRIRSYWAGQGETECVYSPEPHMSAGPPQILNGGIIATLIDCHSVCTAIADAYRREERAPGTEPFIWYATGSMDIRYRSPAVVGSEARLRATVERAEDRKSVIRCTLSSRGQICAEATVVAVRVQGSWRAAGGGSGEDTRQ